MNAIKRDKDGASMALGRFIYFGFGFFGILNVRQGDDGGLMCINGVGKRDRVSLIKFNGPNINQIQTSSPKV